MIEDEKIDLDAYRSVIGRAELSDADKTFLVALHWTETEIGEIASAEQYDAFGRAHAAIEAEARRQGIAIGSMAGAAPEMMQRFVDWTRTPAGIMWTALGGARLGWEMDQE